MAGRSRRRKKIRLSLAGVVLLDILLFVLGMITMVIMIRSNHPGRKSAIDSTSPEEIATIVALSNYAATQTQPENTPVVAATQTQPENTPAVAVPAAEESSDATQEAEQTQTPVVPGDFSAVFPAEDTGEGALLSYQSDRLRIAITKEQAYGATYFVADVWVKDIQAFHTAFAKNAYGRGQHEMPLQIANRANATFAVSGDYYSARIEGVVVRNGQLYRDVMSDDVCILSTDGTMQIYRRDAFSSIETIDSTVWQAWAFGPVLVENGVASDTSGSNIRVKNPRSAIGYYEPGHYCFIVVDGRQKGYSDGMTLDELAATFESLGCRTAYNLDGGATAMMVFQGELVNQPTNGGRTSSDIICF